MKDKKPKRVVSVHLRLTADEADRFAAAAKKAGQTLSGWIRWVAIRGS